MKKFTLILFTAVLGLFSGTTKAQCAANFTWTPMFNGVVTFTSTSAPVNSLTAYYWNFGNGTTYTATGNQGMGTWTTYTANGSYVVTLFILNTAPSCSNQVTYTINVTNAPSGTCNINAGFSNGLGGTPGTMNFANNTTGTTSATTYTWNFGDGSFSNTTNASHTYTANGTYMVVLHASNNTTPACVDSMGVWVVINNICNATPSFTYSQGLNGQVNFQNTSTGTGPNYFYQWQFSNGTQATGQSTSKIFSNGTYTALLTVKNSSIGATCIYTVSQVFAVTSNTCTLNASFTFTQGSSGQVMLTSTSTGTNGNTTYLWNFGNGTSSGLSSPTANYIHGGLHHIMLTIFDSTSPTCSAVVGGSVVINSIPCSADASFTLVPSGTPGHWNAIPSYPYNVAQAQWSWGDGTSSNSLIASHTYSQTNTYNICLTVTATCGSTASACANYSVYKSSGNAMYYVNVKMPEVVDAGNGNPVGVTDIATDRMNVTIAPNPASTEFVLIADGLTRGPARVTVYDGMGRLLISSEHHSDGQMRERIDFSQHSAGIYLVTLENGVQKVTTRLCIEK